MLSQNLIQSLRALFRPRQVVTDPVELITYEVDAAQDRGHPDAVVFPASSDDVVKIARWAAENQAPVVSRGAGTGLSGGAVAEKGGVIVEFARMNHILEFDVQGRSACVEPGVINTGLDELVKTRGLYYPPDPASGRSATLGGNVAENAGGPHCFKYGVTTNYVTGLEFVLAGGRRLKSGGHALDYPEYDFGCLLTGSEGTLGLLTRITVRLMKNPPDLKTLMAAFDSVEQAGRAVSCLIAAGLMPATMEMMDQKIARIVEDFVHSGIRTDAGALLIIEVDGYPASLEAQAEEVARLLKENGGFDLRVARTSEERDQIWYARKSAAGAMARLAPAYLLLDGTVPRSRLAEALEATNRICDQKDLKVGYVFHAGDGNLHPFILMNPGDREQVQRVYQAGQEFMEEVVRLGGSITGEHGVGIEKRPYLSLMYNPVEMSAMLDVKETFDPAYLLNPGKIFPSTERPTRPAIESTIIMDRVWSPASVEEAAKGFAAFSRAHSPVKISAGSPPDGRTGINTEQFNQVLDFSPSDLYIQVGAGMRLADLQETLKKEGKWLPAFSPWPEATLGGLLAANLNGPVRMRYGGLRDQVLAMTFILGDGRIVRAGRPVVKNVAGYDLARFMVGTRGSLGLIADVTLKFAALPRLRRSLFIPVETLDQGLAWGQECLSQALVASAVTLSKGIDIPLRPAGRLYSVPYWLAYSAEGLVEDVSAELDLVRAVLQAAGAPQLFESDQVSGNDLWADLVGSPGEGVVKLRSGLAPADLPRYLQSQTAALDQAAFLVDFANGFLFTSSQFEQLGEAQAWTGYLREKAVDLGGYCVALDLPPEWESPINPWGYQPETIDLMKRLKERWDPANILPNYL